MAIIAIVVLLVQLIIAPYINIGYGMPNFVLCATIVLSLLDSRSPKYILFFLMGLIYDLSSSSPIGLMALTCLVISFILSLLNNIFENDSLGMQIALIVLGCFFGEFLYAILIIICSTDVSFPEAVLYRILPCGLYDSVLAALLSPLFKMIIYGNMKMDDLKFFK